MHTNEELAVLIQQGREDLLPALWDQVQDYVSYRANHYANAWRQVNHNLDPDDLIQVGYFAVLEAVKTYDSSRAGFLNYLTFFLRKAFSGECRLLSPPGEISLETPAGEDYTLGETLEDSQALGNFDDIEDQIFQDQARSVLARAVDDLPDPEGKVIQLRYFEEKTLKETGIETGVSVEAVRQREEKALRNLRRNKAVLKLYYQEKNLYRGTNRRSFERTGYSIQEAILIELERAERKVWFSSAFSSAK